MTGLPETRDRAETSIKTLEIAGKMPGGLMYEFADVIALARLGLEVAFPTEETRERVARAVCKARVCNDWDVSHKPHLKAEAEAFANEVWSECRDEARAALSALTRTNEETT